MNGLLVRRVIEGKKNIGDYIQSLAQEQFWDKTDLIVDREYLNELESPTGEKINVIMNNWWMWHPENFPPSEAVRPLFVSFHISPNIAETMLTPKSVEYLKRYEPIGARDTGTMEILDRFGISNYFSACLTLTLGRIYKSDHHLPKVYFVDPEYSTFKPMAFFDWVKALWMLVRFNRTAGILSKKFPYEKPTVFSKISKRLNKKICAIWFFRQYRQFFSDDILRNAEYMAHMVAVDENTTNEMLLEYARSLVHKYAEAGLVVTSRIHAALPSLGLGTPVVFVSSQKIDSGKIKGRLGGLIDLLNYRLLSSPEGLTVQSDDMKDLLKNGKISLNTKMQNSDAYKKYRDSLGKTVETFVAAPDSYYSK